MERVLSLEGAAQGGLKSSSLEVSREGLDVPLRALGWGQCGDQSQAGHDDPGCLFQPK